MVTGCTPEPEGKPFTGPKSQLTFTSSISWKSLSPKDQESLERENPTPQDIWYSPSGIILSIIPLDFRLTSDHVDSSFASLLDQFPESPSYRSQWETEEFEFRLIRLLTESHLYYKGYANHKETFQGYEVNFITSAGSEEQLLADSATLEGILNSFRL